MTPLVFIIIMYLLCLRMYFIHDKETDADLNDVQNTGQNYVENLGRLNFQVYF